MRTLQFTINGRDLQPASTTTLKGLFPAPNQEIEAEFSFSGEWKSAIKVVAFYSVLGKEYPPQVLNEENRCIIPPEALNLPVFRMQVFGNIGGVIIPTNILSIYQKGGKA